MFNNDLFKKLIVYTRDFVQAKLNQIPIPLLNFEKGDYIVNHCGFFIGIENYDNKNVGCVGFLKSNQNCLIETVEVIANNLFDFCLNKDISIQGFNTSALYFYIIKNCMIIKNPMDWDINKDGIGFQWGKDYKGFYLPYQIKGMTKKEALDRLCSFECKVPSSLWRLPEGLVTKIDCDEYRG